MGWTSFQVSTKRRSQLMDITKSVAAAVERSGARDGVCQVFVAHTTAGVTINEGADPDVARDLKRHLSKLVPKDGEFQHAEGNSDAHIKTALIGPSVSAPVREGRLALGTWQAIFLCEWDGPRTRTVEVAVVPLPSAAREG